MTVAYRVLARKYRPTKLTDLVGQEVLVQTLTQAIQNNRLPHAFLLHGIRGVGKTTTARIIARVLNCLNNQTQEGQTADSCGQCTSCQSLTEDRHLDVIEIDAASRTGVDDIREIIESSRYKAVTGRYKIFIIDEVHMLSKSAFNALLKTLEEPPQHVKFIFATTEIRKIPDTILSRCMRFDLKRIDPGLLVHHLKTIAEQEKCHLDHDAAITLARAADGSMRDGLSLLDQAIALSLGAERKDGLVTITVQTTRDMLGIASQQRLFDLIQTFLNADPSLTLQKLQALIHDGADPQLVLHDLLDSLYSLICLKTTPQFKQYALWSETDYDLAKEMIDSLPISTLMTIWQALLKACSEVASAPVPSQALEMAVLRVCYLANLPSLDTVIRGLRSKDPQPLTKPSEPLPFVRPPYQEAKKNSDLPSCFEDLVALISTAKEPLLYSHLVHDVEMISYQPGSMVLYVKPGTPSAFIPNLKKLLHTLTQQEWSLTISPHPGKGSIKQQQEAAHQELAQQALQHPVVSAFQQAFPDADIKVLK